MRVLWRLLTLRPCEVCRHRTRCWRWHVEVFACPTCKTEIDEFHPRAAQVVRAVFDANKPLITIITGPPATWTTSVPPTV